MRKSYAFLPFRFLRKNGKVLLVNDIGDYHFLNENVFQSFINKELPTDSKEFLDIESKFMAYRGNLPQIIDILSIRYRTKKRFLYDFTSLHMFVITQRCNQKCVYCHASSIDENAEKKYDMDAVTAKKCVELAFASPSPKIKIEFQGGEPLLNFKTIEVIVGYANEINQTKLKELEFVICTNLIAISDYQIKFLKANGITISTSLDGPEDIHDTCRKTRSGTGTYRKVKENISWVMEEIGHNNVSALLTVTPYNLQRLCEVVDEYLELGLNSIFIRMINPYGRVLQNSSNLTYRVDEFIKRYHDALQYIIRLNLEGIFFPEEFAALLLTKILTPFSTGFVDLQSPTGAGISGIIYETNGDVFMADEARMLAKMIGDKTFCLGNVHSNTWEEMFCGERIKKVIEDSCIESSSGCAWCVYQTYCGSDPVRNYIQYGDFKVHAPHSEFCQKHRAIFDIIFNYLRQANTEIQDVFWSWITNRNLSDVKL